jgi:hypothetical protein
MPLAPRPSRWHRVDEQLLVVPDLGGKPATVALKEPTDAIDLVANASISSAAGLTVKDVVVRREV